MGGNVVLAQAPGGKAPVVHNMLLLRKNNIFIARMADAVMAPRTGFASLPFAAFAQSSVSRENNRPSLVSREVRRVISGKVVTVFCKYLIIFSLHCNMDIIAPKVGGSALILTVFALFPNKLWHKT